MAQLSINGILLLDKPAGFSSNGILQRVKRLYQAKKAGHTGSLDPIATGMLPICFGEATKFSQYLLESNKTYQVTARLGIETTTGDTEGDVVTNLPVPAFTRAQLESVLATFLGEIEQIPPMYSAIKHQGKPLYKLARMGVEVERAPRRVHLYSLTLEMIRDDEVCFQVHCSKGTYVRTLVQEIGRLLGCGAHVIALRRLVVTPYETYPMFSMLQLEALLQSGGQAALQSCLLPVETAVNVFPAVKLSSSAAFYLRQGQSIRPSMVIAASHVRLLSENAGFLGVGEVLADGRVKPQRLVQTVIPRSACYDEGSPSN